MFWWLKWNMKCTLALGNNIIIAEIEMNHHSLPRMGAHWWRWKLCLYWNEHNKGRGKIAKYQKTFWGGKKKRKRVNLFGEFCMPKYGSLNNFMGSICPRTAGNLECSIKTYRTQGSSIHISCPIRQVNR